MNRFHQQRQLLPTLFVAVLAAWLASAAGAEGSAAKASPRHAASLPAAANVSQYPAPQADASAPIAETSPTF